MYSFDEDVTKKTGLTFKYKSLIMRGEINEEILNECGKDGWKIVDIIATRIPDTQTRFHIVFIK